MNSPHPTASTPSSMHDSATSETISGTRWVAALAAAIAIQVAAAVAAVLAIGIVLIAAFEDWGNQHDEGTPAYVLLSIPVGIAAPSLFVASGFAASRIIGDRRGWWMLLVGPLVLLVLRAATFAL